MLKVTILVGNPRKSSRTLQLAEALVERLLPAGSARVAVIELADFAPLVFEWPSSAMTDLGAQVADSDLLVVASPTYKASYTGLLKGFLDRYGSGALAGVTAIPLMTGADSGHSLGVEVHLRPLLVELGASVPTRGLYVVMGEMEAMLSSIDAWILPNAELLQSVALVADSLSLAPPASVATS
jgi:FMN reductase